MAARQAVRLRRVALRGHDVGIAEIGSSEQADPALRSVEAHRKTHRVRAS